MRSEDLKNVLNRGNFPIKFTGKVTSSAAADNADKVYLFKPLVPCRLLGANLRIVTAPGGASTLVISKVKDLKNPSPPPDEIVLKGNYGGTAVTNSNLITLATGTTNNVTVQGKPDAHYSSANNAFLPENDDALLITFSDANHDTLMAAELELEFLPI